MYRICFSTLALMIAMVLPVSAQDHKDWCTDAHMQEMDSKIAKMTDTKMQESAKMHLDMSKAEMKKNNTADCIKHMEEAHKAMGM